MVICQRSGAKSAYAQMHVCKQEIKHISLKSKSNVHMNEVGEKKTYGMFHTSMIAVKQISKTKWNEKEGKIMKKIEKMK